ncbi:unnamed protein product [Arctia plantaginis]|uniref:Uncharacterized protein n=1 Tax=Arctia plantaginis TaxID=874455 RepID=A0A8S0ZTZ3_ARCPL|nr:unnamed protein product [Arctia plantaginis]
MNCPVKREKRTEEPPATEKGANFWRENSAQHERRGRVCRERALRNERTPAATATECTATTSATLGQWSGRQNAPPPPQAGTGTSSHRI